MKHILDVKIEVDTNDADYIRDDIRLGVYDDTNKDHLKFIVAIRSLFDCVVLSDGWWDIPLGKIYHKFNENNVVLSDLLTPLLFWADISKLSTIPGIEKIADDLKALDKFCKDPSLTKVWDDEDSEYNVQDFLIDWLDEIRPYIDEMDYCHDATFELFRIPLEYDSSVNIEDIKRQLSL